MENKLEKLSGEYHTVKAEPVFSDRFKKRLGAVMDGFVIPGIVSFFFCTCLAYPLTTRQRRC